MALLQSYETGGDNDQPLGDLSNNEYDIAMSFTPSADVTIDQLSLYLKDHGSPGTITVRIETDSSDVPSGTLVDANATFTIINSDTGTSYDWVLKSFPDTFELTSGTKYWIKCTIPDQSTDVRYSWYRDTGTGDSSHGQSTSFNGGAFSSEDTSRDLYYRLYGDIIITGGLLLASEI